MADVDDEMTTTDQAELQQQVQERSVALQLMVMGVVEAHVGPDSLRRLVATHAVSELLGRLLVTEVQLNPNALRSSMLILDALKDAVTAAVCTPGQVRH